MKRWLSLCLLCSIAPSAIAANHIVNVGGSRNIFSPQTIGITAGDTVTFVNKGGFHNVTADDGSFTCSHGCKGDAQGDTGAPNSSSWVATVTFPNPGQVGYFCETHGAPGMGMFGTINVHAATPVRLQSFRVD